MLGRVLSVTIVLGLLASGPPGVEAAETEEAEAPESAVSSPPMELDDPGTPGSRGIEVNLVGTLSRVGAGRGSETLLDANYGIGDRIQLKFERPYLTESGGGTGFQKGLGAAEFGVKWRFIDHDGLEAAAYPQYSLDDGFALKDEEGNLKETEGRSVYVPLLVSKRLSHVYTLAANVGFRRNLDDRGDDLNLAVGAGRAVGRDTRVLVEVFSERDKHLRNRQTDARVGYMGPLFPKSFAQSSFELDGFSSIGHSLGATEAGETSTSLSFGVSVIKKPRGE